MIKWYMLRVKGSYEEKIRQKIEDFFLTRKLESIFKEVKVLPYGKKKSKVKKNEHSKGLKYGYLYIAVDLEVRPDIKEAISKIDGVYGFVGFTGFGNKQEPIAVSNREINEMLRKGEEVSSLSDLTVYDFVKDQKVKVTPLGDKIGTIKKVLKKHKKLIVVTQLFQKDLTELEVSYAEVKKID